MGKKAKAKKHRSRFVEPIPVDEGPGASHEVTGARSLSTAAWIADEDPNELATSLLSIGAQLQRQLGRGADSDGLTRARLSVLGRLVLGGPATLGHLAAREGVRPPTMTRLVRSMEDAGLVARRRHPTDGRSILVHATPAGEASLASGQTDRLAPLATAIGALDAEGRRDLGQAAMVLDRFLLRVAGARGRR